MLQDLSELLKTSENELDAADTLRIEIREMQEQVQTLGRAIKTEQESVQDLHHSLTRSSESATQLIDSVRSSLSALSNSVRELEGVADDLRMRLRAPVQGAPKWSSLVKTHTDKAT